MKQINYNGTILHYEVVQDEGRFTILSRRTIFYNGTESVPRRKYCLFGPNEAVMKPKYFCTLWFDIENPMYSKEEIRKNLDAAIAVINRKDEIARGEII
jgi:hypothetical protein